MKVFLSWSDSRSKLIAEALRNWLPKVLQSVKPWMSDEDIGAGAQWLSEISQSLDECSVGIICVTPENQHNPWLQFEAGALSKTLDQTCVCPLVFDMTLGQLSGPLTQFQGNELTKNGMLKVLSTLNKKLVDPMDGNELDEILDVWWGRLEDKLNSIPQPDSTPDVRTVGDQLDELLELSREQLRRENLRLERSLKNDDRLDKMITNMEKTGMLLQDKRSSMERELSSLPEMLRKLTNTNVDDGSDHENPLETLALAMTEKFSSEMKDLPDMSHLQNMVGEIKDLQSEYAKHVENMLSPDPQK